MYVPTPPVADAIILPVEPPKYVSFVCDVILTTKRAGCFIVTKDVSIQPFASVAVTV